MSQDVINQWVKKAKASTNSTQGSDAVTVVRRSEKSGRAKTKGEMIMSLADKLFPAFAKIFIGIPDDDGIIMQPAHVRGLALNVAQEVIKREADKKPA